METLLDARNVLSEADADKSPSVLRALELLLEASESGDPVVIQVAANHVAVALGDRKLLAS